MHLKPFLIGIAGPSCSGKTEVAKRVSAVLGAPIVSLDSYYRDLSHMSLADRTRVNFDAPASMDHETVVQHVQQLAAGQPIQKPLYDFALYGPSGESEYIEPADYIIVEGLFALHWADVRDAFDLRVFISATHEVCLSRRIRRDIRQRGRTRESVISQYGETVQPMCDQYILPSARYADLVVDGTGSVKVAVQTVLTHAEDQNRTRTFDKSLNVSANPLSY